MKKILFTLIPMMLMACGGGKKSPQDGGHGIGIDSATVAQTNAEDADYVPQRSDYSFRSDVRTITEEGEVFWDTIVVYLTDAKGHTSVKSCRMTGILTASPTFRWVPDR